ncbi:MAG: tetratricopeptide repeat protein [Sphingomonadaceae bacterium]
MVFKWILVSFACLAALVASPAYAQSPTIEQLSAQIDAAVAAAKYEEAISLGQQALALEEAARGKDDPEVAGTLGLIGGWMGQLDRNADAEPLQRRALAIFAAQLGDNDALTIAAANALAGTLEALGRLTDAYAIHKLTLETITKSYTPKHRLTAISTNNLAFNLARQGRYQEAQTLYDRALSVARQTMDDDDIELARIENNVASNMTARGQYLAAEPLYAQALKIRLAQLSPSDPDVASSYNSLAYNLTAQGRHAEAAPFFAKALDIRIRINPDDRRAATSYNNVAHNLNARQRAKDATPLYERALTIWRRIYGEAHPLTAIGYSNVAVNLEAQGKVAEAQPLFDRALKIRLGVLGPMHPDLASSYFKIARNLRLQGKFAEAEPNYSRAVAIRRASLGGLHPELALALADHAELALQFGGARSGDAVKFAREAASIARKRRDQRVTGDAGGDGEQQALARAQGADASRSDPLAAVFGVMVRADWQRSEAFPKESEALKTEAFEAAQDIETSVAAQTMAQTAARTAAGTGPLTVLVRNQQDLSAKARELDRRLLGALAQGDQPEAIRLRAEIGATGEALSATDAALRKQFPDYAQLVQPRALSIAEIRARLRDDEGLLLIVSIEDDVFSFAVSKSAFLWHRFAGGAKAAAAQVRALHCQIDAASCGAEATDALLDAGSQRGSRFLADGFPAYDRASAYALYRDLIAPVESGLAGKTRLYVTVTGALSGLPLGVLVTSPPLAGEDGADPQVLVATPWFADRYALVSLPSVSVLRALRRKAVAVAGQDVAFVGYGAPLLGVPRPKASKDARLFQSVDADGTALADPDVLRSLASLPGTARELTAMAAELNAPSRDVMLGAAATERAVRADANLSHARVVAFATHGILPLEVTGVEEPGLVFTPPATPSAADDGLLAASEVSRLSLVADWVLLSACNTAASDGTPGADSLSSLARAFLYSGAAALLASHWRVSDEATAQLTVATLAGRSASLSRAQALQAAMRAVRSGKRANGDALPGWDTIWAHPSAWGAFTVISNGDD